MQLQFPSNCEHSSFTVLRTRRINPPLSCAPPNRLLVCTETNRQHKVQVGARWDRQADGCKIIASRFHSSNVTISRATLMEDPAEYFLAMTDWTRPPSPLPPQDFPNSTPDAFNGAYGFVSGVTLEHRLVCVLSRLDGGQRQSVENWTTFCWCIEQILAKGPNISHVSLITNENQSAPARRTTRSLRIIVS